VGAVWSGEVVEALPFSKFRFKVDVAFVAAHLIEFLLVGSARPLTLSIQLRRTRLDIGMPDALVVDVPVELGLEFMAVVDSDLPDPEWECSDQGAMKSMALA
jgi:hypothetical protein